MNTISTTTESKLIDVELMSTHNILESTSVTTFMPEEEASICPLLSSNTNSITIPPTLSHPMTLYNTNKVADNISSDSLHRLGEGQLVDSSSSSGSSSGIAINVSEDVSNNFFNKQTSYKHLQPNNTAIINEVVLIRNNILLIFRILFTVCINNIYIFYFFILYIFIFLFTKGIYWPKLYKWCFSNGCKHTLFCSLELATYTEVYFFYICVGIIGYVHCGCGYDSFFTTDL